VSDDGFNFPSTTCPSKSNTTMSSGLKSSYSTPLGLMHHNPLARSIPLTFPQVNLTNPEGTSA
jgi:hypothetical protein